MMTLFGRDDLSGGLPPQIEVYTDGGCDPNPGPGGWAAIILWQGREWVLSGSDPDTTNNRMELHAPAAALAVLEGLLGRCQVNLHTDSEYLHRGMTEWLDGWVSHGWRTLDNQPVKNQDLWRVLYRLAQAHEVTWHWLKGHAGHTYQERADRLATEARRSRRTRTTGPTARPDGPAVEITIKAACAAARGPGGWGAVLRTGNHVRKLSGGQPATTANAMLIRGAAEALNALTNPCRVTLYSDADYLIKGASLWASAWQARGWTTKEGKPVSNREHWEALLAAARPHHVTWSPAHACATPEDLIQAGELAGQAMSAAVQEG